MSLLKTVQDMQKVAAQSEANRKLREALQADTASSDAQMEARICFISWEFCNLSCHCHLYIYIAF